MNISAEEKKPDFAFPEKVEKAAQSDLKSALKANDGQRVVSALIRLGVARTLINTDSLPGVISQVEVVECKEGDPATKAMLNLLLSEIYTQIYKDNRYLYDSREAAASAGSDFKLWNKQQFAARVAELVKKALENPNALQTVAVQEYKDVVSIDKADWNFYPTLLDFVGTVGARNLGSFISSGEKMLNVSLLDNPTDETLFPGTTSFPMAEVLRIYKLLIERNSDKTAPLYLQTVATEQFINSYLFYDGSDDLFARRMLSLYDENSANEFSAIFLNAAEVNNVASPLAKEIYEKLNDYAKRFPNSRFLPNINNAIQQLSAARVNVSLPAAAAKDAPVKALIHCQNAKTVVMEVFDITAKISDPISIYRADADLLRGLKPVIIKEITFEDVIPFQSEAPTEFVLPKYGIYAVRLTADSSQESGPYSVIRCTDLSVGVSRDVVDNVGWVVNPTDGYPVEGASLMFKPWSRRKAPAALPGETDQDGRMVLQTNENGEVMPFKGEDRYGSTSSVYSKLSRETGRRCRVQIFTSLGLYRPGDQVDFSVVAYTDRDSARSIASNQLIAFELMDANYSPVDTLKLLTDSWGRAQGSFRLPSVGLTGRYAIRVSDSVGGQFSGQTNFMVSDYKLPDFEVETIEIIPPVDSTASAIVKGLATAYSGFPIANASVKATLKVQAGYWWRNFVSQVFYTTDCQTDSDGKFTVEIPAAIIASSPAPKGMFICEMTVTSENGESHELTARFNMGKPLEINVELPGEINIDTKFDAVVSVRNLTGESKDVELEYVVKTDSAEVCRGTMMPGSFADMIRALSTGKYTISFSTVDPSLAEPCQPAVFMAYRPDAPVSPSDRHLWMPDQEVKADAEGVAKVILGASEEDVNVLIITSVDPGKVADYRWVKLRKGMQFMEVKIPEGFDRCRVNFLSVRDFKTCSWETSIARSTAPSIALVETLRDRVTPGEKETVKIQVVPSEGTSAESAVMLDMSNKSIDVLAPNSLRMSNFQRPAIPFSLNGFDFTTISSYVNGRQRYASQYQLVAPEFNLYGYSFTQRGYRGKLMMKMAAATRGGSQLDGYDEVAFERVEMASSMMSAAAANEVVMEDADAGSVVNGSEQPNESQDDNFSPSEVPLAFFSPMLTTNPDGSLEYIYEVPSANTTWVLRGVAYNRGMQTSNFQTEVVASKPVMVTTNAPRFIRCGDRLELPASVMNATDSVVSLDVTAQLFSTASGQLLFTLEKQVSLDARGSETFTLPVSNLDAETGVIFRVKATATEGCPIRYSDGEQVFIPILPSQQDVTESEMFYLAPDQAQFSLEIPAMKDGDRAYLNFTENPAWEVVSALPGLRQSTVNSSIEAASALFSACVAEGIVKDNPEISRVLRKWSESGDSALISNLEKNAELKSMLLSSTPWVSEALSDTEQMQRLRLLFDPKETTSIKKDAIAMLAKCFVDGGWCWTLQYPKLSEWATFVILDQLGELNRMGYLPADSRLGSMISTAIDRFDRQEVADFAKYPKTNRWLYVAIRDNFPEYKLSTAASRVVEAQIQRSLADWKTAEVPLKGVYAMILNNHGYSATARQILDSLREYATKSPEKGMWWQQLDKYSTFWSFDRIGITALLLDAFNAIEPNSEDVNLIRQWLILNKTNNDWGNAVMTTQAVAAILRSGKPLKVNSRGTAIHVGTTLVEPSSPEYATGAFTEDITPLLVHPQTLTVDRQADYPSVGAVVMMRRLPMDSIAATDCKEISVQKNLTVFDGEQWVSSEHFNVGDKVRVELVLRVEDDLSYVVIEDMRAAGLEPVEQLPRPIFSEGLCFYRENRDTQTNIFIDFLPKGTYRLSYDLYASQAGEFSSGAAEVQSQYNPIVAAHSVGQTVNIESKK